MKYATGQTVVLLDTQFKPAGIAVVCAFEENSNKYIVHYTYPGNSQPEVISVPEERLLVYTEMVA